MKTTFCDYEDCDQQPKVSIDDQKFCRYHAVVSLCCGMPQKNVCEAMVDAGRERILRPELLPN